MSDPTIEQKRAVYCVEEAKRRNLYWTGGGWCDWVTELLIDLEQAKAERDVLWEHPAEHIKAERETPNQKEMLKWASDTFGRVALDTNERALRFLEEAIELAQACGVSVEEALTVATRVYARQAGNYYKELGQSAMTLAVLAEWLGIDVDDALLCEWRRIQTIPHEEWARRHSEKVEAGIATPMPDDTPPEAQHDETS